jgi:hypothetical protein
MEYHELLRRQLDESLAVAVADEAERILALARLSGALDDLVHVLDHPALTTARTSTEAGYTITLRLLHRVIMRWCFARDRVDVYLRGDEEQFAQVRMRYVAHAREWRLSVPGVQAELGSFDDEEAKVREMIEDACSAWTPWVNPCSLTGETP